MSGDSKEILQRYESTMSPTQIGGWKWIGGCLCTWEEMKTIIKLVGRDENNVKINGNIY